MDDKCPNCGEWTQASYELYEGTYNDGSKFEPCECEYEGEEEDAHSELP